MAESSLETGRMVSKEFVQGYAQTLLLLREVSSRIQNLRFRCRQLQDYLQAIRLYQGKMGIPVTGADRFHLSLSFSVAHTTSGCSDTVLYLPILQIPLALDRIITACKLKAPKKGPPRLACVRLRQCANRDQPERGKRR